MNDIAKRVSQMETEIYGAARDATRDLTKLVNSTVEEKVDDLIVKVAALDAKIDQRFAELITAITAPPETR